MSSYKRATFLGMTLALATGCTTLAQLTALEVAGAGACITGDLVDDPVARVIGAAGCWLERYAARRLERHTADQRELDAAAKVLARELEACQADPGHADALTEALRVCRELEGAVSP